MYKTELPTKSQIDVVVQMINSFAISHGYELMDLTSPSLQMVVGGEIFKSKTMPGLKLFDHNGQAILAMSWIEIENDNYSVSLWLDETTITSPNAKLLNYLINLALSD